VSFCCGLVLVGLTAFLLGFVALAIYDGVTTVMAVNQLGSLKTALYGDETPSREAFVSCFAPSPELTQAANRHAETLYIHATRKKQNGSSFTILRSSQTAKQSFRASALVDNRLLSWFFRILPAAFVGTGVFAFAALLATGQSAAGENMSAMSIGGVALAVSIFGAMVVVVLQRIVMGFRHAQITALCDSVDAIYRPSRESVSLEEIIRASRESAELMASSSLATQEDFRATMQTAAKEISDKLAENSNTITTSLSDTAKAQGAEITAAVSKALAEPIEQLKTSTEAVASKQGEEVTDLVKSALEAFVRELKSIVGDEFTQLEQLMKSSTESAEKFEKVYNDAFMALADQSTSVRSDLIDEFKSVIAALKEEETERAKAQTESISSIAGEVKTVIESMKADDAERAKSQTESIGSIATDFKTVVEGLKSEDAERARTQAESIGAITAEFKTVVETLKTEDADRMKAQDEALKALTEELTNGMKGVSDGLNEAVKEVATALGNETKEIAEKLAGEANQHAEQFNAALERAITTIEALGTQQLGQATEDLTKTAASFDSLHTSLENLITLVTPTMRQVIENQESLLHAIESESSNSRVLSRAAAEMSAAAQVSRTTVDRFMALAEVLRETSTNMGKAANSNVRTPAASLQAATVRKPAKKVASGGSSFGDAIRQLRDASRDEAGDLPEIE
jgi:phage-related protein